jgi:hypothetical protein
MTPLRILLACAFVALVSSTACSDDGDGAATATTPVSIQTSIVEDDPETVTSPSTGSTEIVPSTNPDAPAGSSELSVAVYWTRPYGTARTIDIPGYADPPGGPYPFVLYGSATNTGTGPIDQPVVTVDWVLDGQTVHTGTARLVDPQGVELTSLAPGATADLIAVVDDEAAAASLPDAVPTFGVRA